MKKSVIAAAVAAVLAVPVVAMADVTVSGGLQAELVSIGGDGTSGLQKGLYAMDGAEYGKQNGGSYGFLKFSASEDLGNGLKALAMWNGVANVGNTGSAGGITGRDSYVGLAGGWGAVLAGTLSTPYKSSTVGWDPFLTTALQARGSGGMSDAQNGYASNALAYAGDFNGVKVVAAMVLDETAGTGTSTNGKNAISFSVNAPAGPVDLALAYVDASKYGDINYLGLGDTASFLGVTSLNTLTATKVGAKWTSGAITVAGQYEMLDLKVTSASTDVKPTVAYVTASYAMGNNTLAASYGSTKWDISGVKDTKYYAVGVIHSFSKTTSSWVGYRSTDADTAAFGGKEDALSAGLRVAF